MADCGHRMSSEDRQVCIVDDMERFSPFWIPSSLGHEVSFPIQGMGLKLAIVIIAEIL